MSSADDRENTHAIVCAQPHASSEEPVSSVDAPETVAVTTYAIATPANLDSIPSVVAELPLSSNGHDIEIQNGSSIPVAVATTISGHADYPLTTESPEPHDARSKWRYRREDRPFICLFCILVLMATMFALHEVLSRDDMHEETEASSSFIYHHYPELMLAHTTSCRRTEVFASQNSSGDTNINSSFCQWEQIGNDLLGPTSGDFFGATLRLGGTAKGSRFSVTAPLYGMNQGLTRVYDISDYTRFGNSTNTTYFFEIIGKSIIGKHENDALKGIMSDDGYHLIMSSIDATLDGQPRVGHFGSFQLSSDTKQYNLYGNEMYGESSSDAFGAAVVNRDGTVVAISDVQYDLQSPESNLTNAGAVNIFRYNIRRNKWSPLGKQLNGSSTNVYWGRKMSLSGDGFIAAIGSRNVDDNRGKVEVYKYESDIMEWSVLGQTIVGLESGDGIGRELELSADGKVLAVTSSLDSTNQNRTGAVQVFQLSNVTQEWERLGNDIVSELTTQSDFGYQLRSSDDGMRLAISEAKYSPNDELLFAGRVRVYDYSQEEQDWVLIGDVVGKRNCDFVGAGFDLSPDGSRLIGEIRLFHLLTDHSTFITQQSFFVCHLKLGFQMPKALVIEGQSAQKTPQKRLSLV